MLDDVRVGSVHCVSKYTEYSSDCPYCNPVPGQNPGVVFTKSVTILKRKNGSKKKGSSSSSNSCVNFTENLVEVCVRVV